MTTTPVQEAITRLHIVRAALDGTVPDSDLAAVEAFTAVRNVLEAIADDTKDCDCERCTLVHLCALHALLLAGLLPLLGVVPGGEHPATRKTFDIFALSVETLVEMHDKEDQ